MDPFPQTVPWSRIRRWPAMAVRLIGRELALWVLLVLLHLALAITLFAAMLPHGNLLAEPVAAILGLPATSWVYLGLARKSDSGRFPAFSPAARLLTGFYALVIASGLAGLGVAALAGGLRLDLLDQDGWSLEIIANPVNTPAVMVVWIAILLGGTACRPFTLAAIVLSRLPLVPAALLGELAHRANPRAVLFLRGCYGAVLVAIVLPYLNWAGLAALPLVLVLTYLAYRDAVEHRTRNRPRETAAAVLRPSPVAR
jgi:hypothetical protein